MTAPTTPATTPRRGQGRPALALVATEARLLLREPGTLFWIIAFPAALLTVLFLIPSFREADADLGGLRVVDLYLPVAVILSALTAGVQTMPATLATYREQGVLKRIATTPARPWQLLAAQWVVHGVAVLAGSVLAVVLGVTAFGIDVPGSPAAYLLVLVLALLAMLSLGGVIAGVAPSTRIAATISTILYFPLMFTAGVWLPVQVMPGLLGTIVEATPLGAAARGLDAAAAGDWPDTQHLLVLVVWTVGLAALSARYFRWK
ncbi:ABC transporter permease [Aeromicrobium alkaliterrae]|uniref:Transport permease protein n=1 Tax=Aeromicrobium alkaliterrae TaxID=302168 RepID=A0ABN2JWZ3_9ACTN